VGGYAIEVEDEKKRNKRSISKILKAIKFPYSLLPCHLEARTFFPKREVATLEHLKSRVTKGKAIGNISSKRWPPVLSAHHKYRVHDSVNQCLCLTTGTDVVERKRSSGN
jgi:hypothetical protein